MVGRRVGAAWLGRTCEPVDERLLVGRLDVRRDPVVEGPGPRHDLAAASLPVELAQVVHDPARAEHEHAFVSQRREGAAECDVVRGIAARLDRELDHRHAGAGDHEPQGHPAAVVEAALRVTHGRESAAREQRGDALGEGRIAWRLVADVVERTREAVEVVDRHEALRGGDRGRGRVPMSRDRDDRTRREGSSQLAEGAGDGVVLEGEGGRAVRQEKGRERHGRLVLVQRIMLGRGPRIQAATAASRPRASFTRERKPSAITKNTPVHAMARRWLPLVTHVTNP